MPGEALEALLDFLRRNRGFDFTRYKRPSLERRIHHRMSEVGIRSLEDYLDYLEVHPEEFAPLFNTILINVTGFFRDPPAWEFLAQQVVPAILAGKDTDGRVRVWSAGCSSGAEAYSQAMVFDDVMGTEQFRARVKIYGTDVDEDAIALARRGEYSSRELAGLSPEQIRRYFEPVGTRRVFRSDLRRSVVFGRHDLTSDTPISRVDLLACRNTLIYLNTEAQADVLARFHFALADDGVLFLGKSEALVRYGDLFEPMDMRYRIFRKVPRRLVLPLSHRDPQLTVPPPLRRAELRPSLEPGRSLFHVAEILVDAAGRLAAAEDASHALLPIDPEDIGRPFEETPVSRTPFDLRKAVRAALDERTSFSMTDLRVEEPAGSQRIIELRVLPLAGAGAAVVFIDATLASELEFAARESQESLAAALEELQSSNEELETTNEELQSTNEELETTNEELQSTNEELETMNEELQSASEQLESMNRELRDRTARLDDANAFLESVLGSLLVGVVVLDDKLVVVSWNRAAEQLWGLWAREVVGRPFFGLDLGLELEQLRPPLRSCLDGGSEREELVVPATNRRGRPIDCRITITPRVEGTGGSGAVILMEETTQ